MNLTQISVIRSLMAEYDAVFKKQFGQNFLTSPEIPGRIASSLTFPGAVPDSGAGRNVLEIGPGIGTLTQCLSECADRVVAVEIDRELLPILDKTLADCENVEIVNADILKTDLAALTGSRFPGGYSVCANLPYYITTPVLMYLLEADSSPREIVVMVQREVADRLCAAPGSPEYGAVTASVAWRGSCEKLFEVPSGCFTPRPKVDSAVLRIELFDEPPVPVKSEKYLRRVIRGAFAQRRKTLVNSLASEFSNFNKAKLAELIALCGISPDIRGERLGIPEFARLSD